MKKAIGYIDGQDGNRMTIYYNGRGREITAEEANGYSEEAGYNPRSETDAREAAAIMWSSQEWGYEEAAR
jgi:hypothetical protein